MYSTIMTRDMLKLATNSTPEHSLISEPFFWYYAEGYSYLAKGWFDLEAANYTHAHANCII